LLLVAEAVAGLLVHISVVQAEQVDCYKAL
jgi:hypothetical protein